jgi:hypothetical protein
MIKYNIQSYYIYILLHLYNSPTKLLRRFSGNTTLLHLYTLISNSYSIFYENAGLVDVGVRVITGEDLSSKVIVVFAE